MLFTENKTLPVRCVHILCMYSIIIYSRGFLVLVRRCLSGFHLLRVTLPVIRIIYYYYIFIWIGNRYYILLHLTATGRNRRSPMHVAIVTNTNYLVIDRHIIFKPQLLRIRRTARTRVVSVIMLFLRTQFIV